MKNKTKTPIKSILSVAEAGTVLASLQDERHKNWGSQNEGVPRGWNRYRPSTFLEVIGAKSDRAIQSHERLEKFLASERPDIDLVLRAKEDLLDSVRDLINYGTEFLKRAEKDDKFFVNNLMR